MLNSNQSAQFPFQRFLVLVSSGYYVLEMAGQARTTKVPGTYHIIYSTLSHAYCMHSRYIGIFSEAKGRGKYSLSRVQYVSIFHKEGLNIFYYMG